MPTPTRARGTSPGARRPGRGEHEPPSRKHHAGSRVVHGSGNTSDFRDMGSS